MGLPCNGFDFGLLGPSASKSVATLMKQFSYAAKIDGELLEQSGTRLAAA